MREIFEKYGVVAPRELEAADPKTDPRPPLVVGVNTGGPFHRRKLARNWKTLLSLSESPIPARALSVIRDKIMALDYDLKPKEGLEEERFDDEIEDIRAVIENPNPEDGDWPTFIGQIVEDTLVFDSGAWEYVEHPKFIDGNETLGLFPIPGFTLERAKSWNGDPSKPRWAQRIEQAKVLPLLDRDVEVLIHRKRSSLPYGFSPLETVVGLMDSWLNLTSYQAQVASDAYPAFLIHLGEDTSQEQIDGFKIYWENEMRGAGKPGFFGNMKNPKVLELKAKEDGGLYLQYYEQLVRTIAFVFKLKPQDFGVERDVNRSQGEVSQSASIEEAIKPYARLIVRRINNRLIPRIATVLNKPTVADVVFDYPNIDPWDEREQASIRRINVRDDVITINEARNEIGKGPLQSGNGDKTLSEYRADLGFDVTQNNPDKQDPDTGTSPDDETDPET